MCYTCNEQKTLYVKAPGKWAEAAIPVRLLCYTLAEKLRHDLFPKHIDKALLLQIDVVQYQLAEA